MIDSGRYLWNCMKYIDLNLIRAGVVEKPSDWDWCGFNEIIGTRKKQPIKYPGDFIPKSI